MAEVAQPPSMAELWEKYARHHDNCGYVRKHLPCDCGLQQAHIEINSQMTAALAWKEAIIDAAVVDWVYVAEHDENPRKAINDLLCWAQKIALDPAVSKEAARVHQKLQDMIDEIDRLKSLMRQGSAT